MESDQDLEFRRLTEELSSVAAALPPPPPPSVCGGATTALPTTIYSQASTCRPLTVTASSSSATGNITATASELPYLGRSSSTPTGQQQGSGLHAAGPPQPGVYGMAPPGPAATLGNWGQHWPPLYGPQYAWQSAFPHMNPMVCISILMGAVYT